MNDSKQGYVSKELTHFVGRKLNEQAQYQLLVKILKTGQLLHPPFNPNISGNLVVYTGESICENKMYNPEVVCFCDIPVEKLDLHMNKYSNFGLSFLKKYLIERGANPVFYIAKNSVIGDPFFGYTTQGEHFDGMIKKYHEFLQRIDELIMSGSKAPGVPKESHQLRDLQFFLDFRIFSYLKCFDASKADEDPDNFYMEREWRVIGNIKFDIINVQRIIIPAKYDIQFKKDVPEYQGQKKIV